MIKQKNAGTCKRCSYHLCFLSTSLGVCGFTQSEREKCVLCESSPRLASEQRRRRHRSRQTLVVDLCFEVTQNYPIATEKDVLRDSSTRLASTERRPRCGGSHRTASDEQPKSHAWEKSRLTKNQKRRELFYMNISGEEFIFITVLN